MREAGGRLTPIPSLLELVERQRGLVDARLGGPARWRGPLRKRQDPERVRRVAEAFDDLVARIERDDRSPLTVDDLLGLHRVVESDGAFRTGGARVGSTPVPHRSDTVPDLVATSLARAADGVEPAPLAAARVHLELLLIHPFRDGNGRIARLAASWVLLRSGYRSTLLTAVEQHSRGDREAYGLAFKLLTVGGVDTQRPWLRMALRQMAAASEHASAFREREAEMREALRMAAVPARKHDRLLIAHDFEGAVVDQLAGFDRWSEISRSLAPDAASQIRRLLAEEADRPAR